MNTDMMKNRMNGFKRGEMHHHDKKCHEQFHDIKKAGVMRVVHALIINVFEVDVKRNESCEGLSEFIMSLEFVIFMYHLNQDRDNRN